MMGVRQREQLTFIASIIIIIMRFHYLEEKSILSLFFICEKNEGVLKSETAIPENTLFIL